MPLAAWQATIVDEAGDVQAGASIEVRRESTGALAAIYSDRDGNTPLSNPFNADSSGFARFHVSGGAFRITATKDGFSRTWRYVGIGLASEYDNLPSTRVFYERTVTEIAAGVTPNDYSYPPGNVLRYGADRTGGSDSTDAFDDAIASGVRVFVPAGVYKVTDIEVVDGLWIEGETDGPNGVTILEVGTNDSGAFRHSASTSLFWITIKNMHIRAAAGVTGARAYLQDDRSQFTAHATFENVSTDKNLVVAYEGFFIISDWYRCWDGYAGQYIDGQEHQFITSLPAAWGQGNQTNLCGIHACRVFGATSGVAAAIDVGWGCEWFIDQQTQLEDMDAPAFRFRGVLGGRIEAWIENIRASRLGIWDVSPDVVQGCGAWSIRNTMCAVYGFTGTELFQFGLFAAMGVTMESLDFIQVPAGVNLASNVAAVEKAVNIKVHSGVGAAGFINVPMDRSDTFEVTLNGVDSTVTGTARFEQRGRMVTLLIPTLSGTSNDPTCSITGLPASLHPIRTQGNLLASVVDNGTTGVGVLQLTNSGVITATPGIAAAAGDWTSSGTKGVGAFNMTYLLS